MNVDMISKPLVTYVLFAYNQENYIQEAVLSAFSQDYEPLQIILSDDCSSDNTFEIIQDLCVKYNGPHKIVSNRNAENHGLAKHINKVVKMAEGDIIVWAAGDDISLSHKVSSLVAPMILDKSVVGVHSPVIEMDVNGVLGKKRYLYDNDRLDDLAYIVNSGAAVASQAHGFRKSIFEYFGPLNSSVNNEGKVLSFRESWLGKIIYIDQITVQYRLGTGVSTYKGDDVNELTINEPLKVSSWRYYSLKQIHKDYMKIRDKRPDLEELILQKKEFSRKLFLINKNPWEFKALVSILKNRCCVYQALMAFIRRNSPYFVRYIYARLYVKSR